MSSIPLFMTDDHRRCDSLFSQAETTISKGQWELASGQWRSFQQAVEQHFRMEEEVLFPAFEQATGSSAGPTAVMRMEHQQMRQLFSQIVEGLSEPDSDELLGLTETLMVLMQQHNMKEEQILYPMTDQSLGPQGEEIISRMQGIG